MKFAPMNYHYLRYPLTKFLDKVERSPFDSIDLYCSAPQLNLFDHPLSHLLELDGELRRRHLSVAAMTPENCVYPVNFCTQDRITRESSLRYYQRAIDTAEFLGCPRVQISTGFGYFDAPREEAWNNCRESMAQLAAYAERKHVTLLLEELKNTTTNVLITSRDIAKMLGQGGYGSDDLCRRDGGGLLCKSGQPDAVCPFQRPGTYGARRWRFPHERLLRADQSAGL